MLKAMKTTRPVQQQGAILLESLIALLIFSMGILALVGLQATMVKHTASAQYRSLASYIVQQKLGELWADPSHIVAVTDQALDDLPNGLYSISSPSAGEVNIVVSWRAPDESTRHNVSTYARIMGAN